MTAGTLTRVMAGCFALSAFAVAIVAGMAGYGSAADILSRALIAMVLCYPVGMIAGMICERVVNERVAQHELDHPVPDVADDAHYQTEGGAPAVHREHDDAEMQEVIEV